VPRVSSFLFGGIFTSPPPPFYNCHLSSVRCGRGGAWNVMHFSKKYFVFTARNERDFLYLWYLFLWQSINKTPQVYERKGEYGRSEEGGAGGAPRKRRWSANPTSMRVNASPSPDATTAPSIPTSGRSARAMVSMWNAMPWRCILNCCGRWMAW